MFVKLAPHLNAETFVGPFIIQPNRLYPLGKAMTDLDPQHPSVEDALNRGLLIRIAEEVKKEEVATPVVIPPEEPEEKSFYEEVKVIDKVLEAENKAPSSPPTLPVEPDTRLIKESEDRPSKKSNKKKKS